METMDKECVFCENALESAPTGVGWLQFGRKGIHHACIERLHDISKAIRSTEPSFVQPVPPQMEIHEHGLWDGDIDD